MDTKETLRKVYRSKRKAFTVVEYQSKSKAITEHFSTSFGMKSWNNVHIYLSNEKTQEPDTSGIINLLANKGTNISIPKVGPDNTMESILLKKSTKLIEGHYGIAEPSSGDLVDPQDIDLLILPLLIFDSKGYRVGYGKGYYDRFLKRCQPQAIKVGLCFFPPIKAIEDLNEHDVPLDYCITPTRIYQF